MRRLWLALFTALSCTAVSSGSLYGPWERFTSKDLGFEVLSVSDWRVHQGKDLIVFGVERPDVRLSVGRIPAGTEPIETSVHQLVDIQHWRHVLQTVCLVDGRPAVQIEGRTDTGYVRDYYVDNGRFWYWISFRAGPTPHWKEFEPSFDIVAHSFHFL